MDNIISDVILFWAVELETPQQCHIYSSSDMMAIAPNSTRPGRDLIAGSYHCFIWSLLSLERDNANRANMCWGAIDLLGKQE